MKYHTFLHFSDEATFVSYSDDLNVVVTAKHTEDVHFYAAKTVEAEKTEFTLVNENRSGLNNEP